MERHRACGSSATLPQLFAAQAARSPEAVAVVCEEQTLSYGSSMRVPTSWHIICAALGVGPEVVVGLCVERSPEMVIGLLGILKAGGAYLPLDPPIRKSASPSCWAMPEPACWSPRRGSPSGCPRPACTACGSMPTGPPSPATPPPRHNCASTRKTPPTSSTHQDPQESLKGSVSRIGGIPHLFMAPQNDRFGIEARGRVDLQFASLSFDAAVSEISVLAGIGGAAFIVAAPDRAPAVMA